MSVVDARGRPAQSRAHPRSLRTVLRSDQAAQAASIVFAVVAWQAIAGAFERIPTILEVISVLRDEISNGEFFSAFGFTLERFFVGVGLAFAIGLVLGVVLGLSRFARLFMGDIVVVAVGVPGVIWALLCILWFGFGFKAPVVAVVLTTVPFIVLNVSQGVQARSRDLTRMSTAFGVPLVRRIRHLVLPAVSDYIFAGIRFAIIMGWNLVLLTEWFGGADGVGHRTRYWYDANQFDGFVSWVVFFIAFIVILDRLVLERISRHVFRWRSQEPAR
jgi:ABC-type nitrate/sulfonate/bicarbonate transport system permease component